MAGQTEISITVEWWDGITGTWGDLGEARNHGDALNRIGGLMAADGEPQRYRIVERRVTTFDLPTD